MTQSLKIKWPIQTLFLCVRLVIILRLFALIAAHTAKNVDFGGKAQEDRGYESESQ